MKIYECEIPALPPSVNALYKRNRNGGVRKNESVLVFEKEAMVALPKSDTPLEGILFVTIDYTFSKNEKFLKSDIDNCLKVTLDMLTHFGIIKDDRFIMDIHARKHKGQKDQTKIKVIQE